MASSLPNLLPLLCVQADGLKQYEERPCEGCAEPNFTTSGILDVIEDAKTKYTFDDNRIYLSGYSMVGCANQPWGTPSGICRS